MYGSSVYSTGSPVNKHTSYQMEIETHSYKCVYTPVGGFTQVQAPWTCSAGLMENIGLFQRCNGSTHTWMIWGQAKWAIQ